MAVIVTTKIKGDKIMELSIALVDLIKKSSFCEEEITEDLSLKDDLGFDSLTLVSFIVELEQSLNLYFDEADLDPGKLIYIRDLNHLIIKAQKG